MFEHVVNSVYIPADDVISHRLDEFGGLSSAGFMILYLRMDGLGTLGLAR